jgi:hypothetical protein
MLTGEGQRSREFDSRGKPKQSTEEGKKIVYAKRKCQIIFKAGIVTKRKVRTGDAPRKHDIMHQGSYLLVIMIIIVGRVV